MRNPVWINDHLFNYGRYDEIPQQIFNSINANLDKVLSKDPLVSVVITAWNEEVNILKTISSLSKIKSRYSFEIIVINNNSDDNTQATLNKLHVKSFFQPVQGWGPARQLGLEKASGRYVLMADADAIYPPLWLEEMVNMLADPGVVCVYGRYSFIAEKGYPRWQLWVHEKLKDAIANVRHVKRPYLNAYGISMGVVKEYALKVGYVMEKIRGEDGRMCFDLMQFGEIKQVKSDAARIWTYPRTLQKDGSLRRALFKRIGKELHRLHTMFYPLPAHDTKTSSND